MCLALTGVHWESNLCIRKEGCKYICHHLKPGIDLICCYETLPYTKFHMYLNLQRLPNWSSKRKQGKVRKKRNTVHMSYLRWLIWFPSARSTRESKFWTWKRISLKLESLYLMFIRRLCLPASTLMLEPNYGVLVLLDCIFRELLNIN